MKEKTKKFTGIYFLLFVVLLYITIAIFRPDMLVLVFNSFLSLLEKIVPVFILIFVFMVVINYFFKPKQIVEHMGEEAGIKGWLISIISGIFSTGPIFMWYPLLSDLQRKGARDGYLAAFLYNRAIKPPLLPLLIFYFGFFYTVILAVVMVVFSVFQGIILEAILKDDR